MIYKFVNILIILRGSNKMYIYIFFYKFEKLKKLELTLRELALISLTNKFLFLIIRIKVTDIYQCKFSFF